MGFIDDLLTIFYTDKRHLDREKRLEVNLGKSRSNLGSKFKSKNS